MDKIASYTLLSIPAGLPRLWNISTVVFSKGSRLNLSDYIINVVYSMSYERGRHVYHMYCSA